MAGWRPKKGTEKVLGLLSVGCMVYSVQCSCPHSSVLTFIHETLAIGSLRARGTTAPKNNLAVTQLTSYNPDPQLQLHQYHGPGNDDWSTSKQSQNHKPTHLRFCCKMFIENTVHQLRETLCLHQAVMLLGVIQDAFICAFGHNDGKRARVVLNWVGKISHSRQNAEVLWVMRIIMGIFFCLMMWLGALCRHPFKDSKIGGQEQAGMGGRLSSV